MFIICLLGIWFTNKRGITGDQSQIPPERSEWTGRRRSHETWLKIFCKSNSLWSPQPSISFSLAFFLAILGFCVHVVNIYNPYRSLQEYTTLTVKIVEDQYFVCVDRPKIPGARSVRRVGESHERSPLEEIGGFWSGHVRIDSEGWKCRMASQIGLLVAEFVVLPGELRTWLESLNLNWLNWFRI